MSFSCYYIHGCGVPFSDQKVKFTIAGSPDLLWEKQTIFRSGIYDASSKRNQHTWSHKCMASLSQKPAGKLPERSAEDWKNPLGHTCFAGAPMWLYPAFVVLQPGILTVIESRKSCDIQSLGWRKGCTPWKINMEHNHRGLEDYFPF